MQTQKQAEPTGGRRIITQVASLGELVGAHPSALRDIYASGKPTDPAELGDAPRGRVLALTPLSRAYMLTRSVLALLAHDAMPWKGKEFDHGGNSGTNVVLGKHVLRFRTALEPSEIDGLPTLALIYGDKAFRNPWPVRAIRDELRTVGGGVAIGPAFMTWRGATTPLLWFGLERA
jgi:hypothetical protein